MTKMRLEIVMCLLFVCYVNCQSNSTQKSTFKNSSSSSISTSNEYAFERFVSKYKKLPLTRNRSVFNKRPTYQGFQKQANNSFESIFQMSKLGREQSVTTKTTKAINSKKLYRSKVKLAKSFKSTKIPISKGIYQIKSIYNSLKSGNAVLNDKSINTVRYIPSVKG